MKHQRLKSGNLYFNDKLSSRRTAPRESINVVGKIRQPGRKPVISHIRDLSTAGFRMYYINSINQEEMLWIHLPSFAPMHANVKWVSRSEYGCEFATPLYPSVCDHIVRLYKY